MENIYVLHFFYAFISNYTNILLYLHYIYSIMFDGIIYKYTCRLSCRSYVGQAIGDGEERHRQFLSIGTTYTSGRSAIDNARRKYGPESFDYEVIERLSYDSIEARSVGLNEREVYWIAYYDTYRHGYNSTKGGDGCSGFKQPDHVIEMLHNRRASEETRRRKSRPVVCYRVSTGEFVGEFYGAKVASEELGVSPASITLCCQRKTTCVFDFLFLYKDSTDDALSILSDVQSKVSKRPKRVDSDFEIFGFSAKDGSFVKSWPNVHALVKELDIQNRVSRILDAVDGNPPKVYGFIFLRSMDLDEVARRLLYNPWAKSTNILKTKAREACIRAVVATCITTQESVVYPSLIEASAATGVRSSHITGCCLGRYKQGKGYIFRYLDDVNAPSLSELSADYFDRGAKRRKSVISTRLVDGVTSQFKSSAEAGSVLGINRTSIVCCCTGKIQSVKGYTFRYASCE